MESWVFWKIVNEGISRSSKDGGKLCSRFCCKNGGKPYRRSCLWKGEGKNCFSVMCVDNIALFSAGLSFAMFIFLLTPFDTWDCYYLVSNLNLVLLIKKSSNVLLWSSKDEEITLPQGFICVCIWYFIGAIQRKVLSKVEVLGKPYKVGMVIYGDSI